MRREPRSAPTGTMRRAAVQSRTITDAPSPNCAGLDQPDANLARHSIGYLG
jgi:hypothetical protein